MTDETNPGDDAPPDTPGTGEDVCPKCSGKGRIDGQECANCGGTGKVIQGIGGGDSLPAYIEASCIHRELFDDPHHHRL